MTHSEPPLSAPVDPGTHIGHVHLKVADPDGNGVERYWDRPAEEWPRTPSGELAMFNHHFDLDELLRQ